VAARRAAPPCATPPPRHRAQRAGRGAAGLLRWVHTWVRSGSPAAIRRGAWAPRTDPIRLLPTLREVP